MWNLKGSSPGAKAVSPSLKAGWYDTFLKEFIIPHRDGHTELLVISRRPVAAPPFLLSITLTQPAGLGHYTSKKEAH